MKELYTIKQGNHYASGLNFKLHSGLEKLSFSITPDENCLYNLGNNNNMDINKIFGVTWGLDPENNSFRSGWNCYKQNGLLQYHYYKHNYGLRDPAPQDDYDKSLLFEVKPKETTRFDVIFNRKGNEIAIATNVYTSNLSFKVIPFNFNGVPTWGRYNYPYFGGDETAQHDMSMRIKQY